jgi:hypothetical protein
MATDKQIAFITSLVAKSAYPSIIDAINAYGLGLRTARDLSVIEASEMIDFLTGKPQRASKAPGEGTRVRHATFGEGTVQYLAPRKEAAVLFDSASGTRTFPLSILEVI